MSQPEDSLTRERHDIIYELCIVTVGIYVHFYGECPVAAGETEEGFTNMSQVLQIMLLCCTVLCMCHAVYTPTIFSVMLLTVMTEFQNGAGL